VHQSAVSRRGTRYCPLVAEGKLVVLDLEPELPSVPYAAMFRSDQPSHFAMELAEFARELCDFDQQFQ
jgi:hypothetical protein